MDSMLKKIRIGAFVFLAALCALTLSPIAYSILTYTDTILNTMDVGSKIAYVGVLIFIGFVRIGLSFVFVINKGKCTTCGISIKDDYSYCSLCDNLKQAEFRSTKETLCCAFAIRKYLHLMRSKIITSRNMRINK